MVPDEPLRSLRHFVCIPNVRYMRRSIHALILSLIALSAVAQTGGYVGAKVVPTSAWILNQNNFEVLFPFPEIADSEIAYDLTPSIAAGLVGGYIFDDERWGIQGELLYYRGGQRYSDTYSIRMEQDVERTVILHSIQVPLKAMYRTRSVRNDHGFFAGLGPYIGFELAERETIRYDPEPASADQLDFTGRKIAPLDFGLALELGGEFSITRRLVITTGLDLGVGLIDINAREVRDIGWFSKNDDSYQPSRSFRAGISIGILYSLRRRYY